MSGRLNGKRNPYPALILLLISIVFFWKAATLQGIFVTGDIDGSDIMYFNFPSRDFLSHSLKNGVFPLWTKNIYNGFPMFAEGQGGFLYPLNIVLFGLLPSFAAYNFSVILAFLLTGVFTYLYARSINISRNGALIAGIILMLGGFFVTHLKQMNMINTAMWFPLMLFFVEKHLKKNNLIYIVFAGIAFCMQVLAGNPQIAYYTIIFLVLYLAFRLYAVNKKEKSGYGKIVLKLVVAVSVIVVIGIGLSAVQILPGYELKGLSMRSEMSYNEATLWAYEPPDLMLFLSPYHYGDPAKRTYERGNTIFWENCIYVGLLPLLLSLYAVIVGFKKNGYIRFFLLSGIFFLLVVMPKTTPLFRILWHVIPGFSLFRFPHRFLLFVEFSLAILAAYGFDGIMKRLSEKAAKTRVINKNSPESSKDKVVSTHPGARYGVLIGWGITALIVFDLFRFGVNHNPTIKPEKWFEKPDTVKFLEGTPGMFRTLCIGRGPAWRCANAEAKGWGGDLSQFVRHRKMLPENFNMVYNIASFSGYTSFYLQRFADVTSSIRNNIHLGNYPDWKASMPYSVVKYLGLGNVKYILTIYNFDNENLKLVMKTALNDMTGDIKVYENRLFMPRAFVVPGAKYIKDRYKNGSALFDRGFDPARTITIEKQVSHGSLSVEGSTVSIDEYSDKEVIISTNLTDDGFLVLTDTYYPGWNVYVDGIKGEILQADYLFRAVALEKGKHRVRFEYKPASFRTGLCISLFFMLLVVVGIIRISKGYNSAYSA